MNKRCVHGRSKYRCRDCGTGYCAHGRQKAQCRECGRGYCERHNTRKDRCALCNGGARCAHAKLRARCPVCTPLERLLGLSTQCRACGVTQVCRAHMAVRGGPQLCAACDDSERSPALHKERALHDRLVKEHQVPPASAVDDKVVGGRACSVGQRRPDLAWVTPTYVVSVEIDEDSHAGRAPSCELKKAQDTRFGAEMGSKPLLLIRYNPDQWDGAAAAGAGAGAPPHREALLAAVLKWVLRNVRARDLDPLKPNLAFLFYHSRGGKHIHAADAAGLPLITLPCRWPHHDHHFWPDTPLALKNISAQFRQPRA